MNHHSDLPASFVTLITYVSTVESLHLDSVRMYMDTYTHAHVHSCSHPHPHHVYLCSHVRTALYISMYSNPFYIQIYLLIFS